MPASATLLNRLVHMHSHSLAQYLHFAMPWGPTQNGVAVLKHMIDAQSAMADRLLELTQQRRCDVLPGNYPLHYASYHDLSLDFLTPHLIRQQEADIRSLERAVGQLENDPLAMSLVQEALGEAKGHLDSLRDISPATAV